MSDDLTRFTIEVSRALMIPERMLLGEWTINPCETITNIYSEEFLRMMAEQISLDIDREIMEAMINPDSQYLNYFIDDPKLYRKEILIKKYGFR